MSKFCKFCEIEHPATAEFWYMGRGKVSRCKIQKKAYNAANAEAISRNKKFYQKSNAVAIAEQHKEYRKANAEVIAVREKAYRKANAVVIAEQQNAYRIANLEALKVKKKAYRKAHPEVARVSQKAYRAANIQNIRAHARSRTKNDQQFKLARNLRIRLSKAIRNQAKRGSAVRDLGCSIEFLESYLQARFTSEMSWDNYGTAWHIDHIYPLAKVDLEDRAQFLKACNYRNLQPMLIRDNLAKSDSVSQETEEWFMGLEV